MSVTTMRCCGLRRDPGDNSNRTTELLGPVVWHHPRINPDRGPSLDRCWLPDWAAHRLEPDAPGVLVDSCRSRMASRPSLTRRRGGGSTRALHDRVRGRGIGLLYCDWSVCRRNRCGPDHRWGRAAQVG